MNAKFTKMLKGKTIAYVEECPDNLMQDYWSKRPHIIVFTDNSILIPEKDDEGNDGGAVTYIESENNEIKETKLYTL